MTETFRVRFDGAVSNLSWLKMSLLIAGGLDQMAFKGPFQPKLFQDSMVIQGIFTHSLFQNDYIQCPLFFPCWIRCVTMKAKTRKKEFFILLGNLKKRFIIFRCLYYFYDRRKVFILGHQFEKLNISSMLVLGLSMFFLFLF